MDTFGKMAFALTHIFIFFVAAIHGKSTPSKITDSIREVYTSVSTFSSTLEKTYSPPELEIVESIALHVLEKVPVIGEAISILTDATESERETQILQELQTLSIQLNSLSTELELVKKALASIPRIIQVSIIQKQVAEDGREMENCYKNYRLFLDEPNSTALKYRLSECYGKIQFLRELGDILTGKVITFNQRSIFDEIISLSGTCNGTEITSAFKYIYGLYIKGCVSITLAENIKFSTETVVSKECKSVSTSIFRYSNNVYLRCQNKDVCDENKDADRISDIIGGNTDLKLINSILQREFPWYYFTIIATEKDVIANFSGNGSLPSMMTLKLHEHNYLTIVWFPEKNNALLNDSNSFLYQLTLYQLYRPENGLQLSFLESSDYSKPYTTVSGRVPFKSKPAEIFISCRHYRMYTQKSPLDGDKNLSIWDKFMNLSLEERTGIAIGVCLVGVLLCFLTPYVTYKIHKIRRDKFDN